MKVGLNRKGWQPQRHLPGYKSEPAIPAEYYEEEMSPEEFALRIATALRTNPGLKQDENDEYVHAPAFAFILGQDPGRFKVRATEGEVGISHWPTGVTVQEICDGKLVQVSFQHNDSDELYFFRVSENGLQYIPYAEGCCVRTSERGQRAFTRDFNVPRENPLWPWLAFYPEKFAGLIELSNILDPGDENPLTGLIGAKDAPVRTCAKQVASKIERGCKQWALDIVATL